MATHEDRLYPSAVCDSSTFTATLRTATSDVLKMSTFILV